MSPPLPYGIRVLALSHARAWPTAAWTGLATAVGAGLTLSLSEWAALVALTAVCGSAVRMTTAHLVEVWAATRDAGLPALAATSEYDAATGAALRGLVRSPIVPPTSP